MGVKIVIMRAYDNIGSAMSDCKQSAAAFASCVIARPLGRGNLFPNL